MSASDWSIDRELCGLANRESVADSLASLGLVPTGVDFVIDATESWWRAGEETYAFRFSIATGDVRHHLFLKACVAYDPLCTLADILESWIERRRLLSSVGVSTPRLFAYGKGVILEEFVPLELVPLLALAPSLLQDKLLLELASFAGKMALCGFCPLDPYSDLRSRGTDVVVVDFGQDLGAPHVDATASESLFNRLMQRLWAVDIAPSRATVAAMEGSFQSARRAGVDMHGPVN